MDNAQAQIFARDISELGQVANWKIGKYVSHGKSAVLFEAHRGEVQAVIKLFHPGLIEAYGRDSQIIRVSRERELVERQHPNIARVLDAGICEASQLLFVAMENAGGTQLSQCLNLIPTSQIPALVEQLARAAMQLEDWGFTHRDIKPDNIHIDDEFGSLILLDFGVMKPHGDESATMLIADKPFVGTHQYSPPEMIHGQEEDTVDGWRAVTFYQIGAVIHDLVTRVPIFKYATSRNADLVRAIDNDVIVVEDDGVGSLLCNLATRCLVKNPTDRLRLVSWHDFMFSELQTEILSLDEKTDALIRRTRLGKVLRKLDVVQAREDERLRRLQVDETIRAAKTSFDSVLCDLGELLPARRTIMKTEVHPNPGLTYEFDVARDHVFEFNLRLQISLEFHDSRDAVDVYVRASKGLADTEIGWTHLGPSLRSLTGFENAFKRWALSIIEEIVD